MADMEIVTPSKEVLEFIQDEGGDILKLCYQCSLCTATCPWNRVRSFLVRRLIHQSQLGLTDFEDGDVWTCVGCTHWQALTTRQIMAEIEGVLV